jgi:peroxiredoxin
MAQTQIGPPAVGDQAPDFTLQDANRKPVSLHDFAGRTVVLAFFPAAFSNTCTAEMGVMRDSLSQFGHANAQVLGISVYLPFSLKQFKQMQHINFPLLSDFDRQVIETYGVVDRNFSGFTGGVARRAVFVVDGSGRIAWEWIADEPGQQPDYARVLEVVDQIANG